MSNDIKGYYARLGLTSDASDTDIKAAYRKLAKEHHPDSGNSNDAGARFRAVTEAYAELGNPQSRSAYDQLSATARATRSQSGNQQIEPISCDSCGKVTAQPRFVVYRQVVSLLLATIRTPIQGIFCANCAASKSLRATAITATVGWWGFPWGPVYSIAECFRNAFGGSTNTAANERLLWHNALAFALNGQSQLALALADKVRVGQDRELAAAAAKLIAHFRSHGTELGSAVLKDPWAKSPGHLMVHLVMVAAIPALCSAIVFGAFDQQSRENRPTPAPPLPDIASSNLEDQPLLDDVESPSNKAIAVPTCAKNPVNGKVLTGGKRLKKRGHVLDISNGSSGDSIVKLRDTTTGSSVVSFFIKSGKSASLAGIPDGTYTIQYAFGSSLAADCRSFTRIDSAGQFPQNETLQTERMEDLLGITTRRMRLSYTLYTVPGGNVRPETISADAFGSD